MNSICQKLNFSFLVLTLAAGCVSQHPNTQAAVNPSVRCNQQKRSIASALPVLKKEDCEHLFKTVEP